MPGSRRWLRGYCRGPLLRFVPGRRSRESLGTRLRACRFHPAPTSQGASYLDLIEVVVLTATSRLCGKAGGLEPPAHDDLLLRVEADGVFAVGVEVAEEGVFPAGEGEERHGGGDAYVDADHAELVAGTVMAGTFTAGGEDGRGVAEGAAIY